MTTTRELREKASVKHEKACDAYERARDRECDTHSDLLQAIEAERQESLGDICRPHGVL